jgi:hypothetical protein
LIEREVGIMREAAASNGVRGSHGMMFENGRGLGSGFGVVLGSEGVWDAAK